MKSFNPYTATRNLRDILTNLIRYSHRCLLCDTPGDARICQTCQTYFDSPRHYCQQCAAPLLHRTPYCGACLRQKPDFDRVYSPFLYQQPLKQLISDYKHKGHHHVGRGLSEVLSESIRKHYQSQHLALPEKLVAVPLHWRRQWRRGFNQAEEISHNLNQLLNIKQFYGVKRIRSTPAQQQLSRKERLINLKNCFKATEPLSGESIAIVDDVMTTGATANLLAKTLKQAGAGEVTVWTLARTPDRRS